MSLQLDPIYPSPVIQLVDQIGDASLTLSVDQQAITSSLLSVMRGPPGESSISRAFTAAADGAQTFTLDVQIATPLALYINGLRQSLGGYTVGPDTLTVQDSLMLMIGDVVELQFVQG